MEGDSKNVKPSRNPVTQVFRAMNVQNAKQRIQTAKKRIRMLREDRSSHALYDRRGYIRP